MPALPLISSRGQRLLVHSVTVHPNGPREGFQVEVKGNLAALIGGDAFPQAVYSGGRVVAEDRYIAKPTTDDAVFCYWSSCLPRRKRPQPPRMRLRKRALPSEGKGQKFESSRARHFSTT